MLKPVFTIILGLFIFGGAFAQKKSDTSVYYLKNSGKVVSTKDSADYFIVVFPPDSSIDKNLFIVKGFYPDGKIRFIAKSSNNSLKLMYQGTMTAYFPTGSKRGIMNFKNGKHVGDETEYFPNGKLYNIKTRLSDKDFLYKECKDSTGKALTENGNGQWIEFDENFTRIKVEGQVRNSLGYGEWRTRTTDTSDVISEYKEGKIVSMANSYKSGNKIYFMVETAPEFPGGAAAFNTYLGNNIRYPIVARKNGTQGRVIITFIVDINGSLTDVKVARGIGDGCDEEAVRVLKLCPAWTAGMQNGKPVRVVYTVPLSFGLTK